MNNNDKSISRIFKLVQYILQHSFRDVRCVFNSFNELCKSIDEFVFVVFAYLCTLSTREALFFFESSPPFVRPPRGICKRKLQLDLHVLANDLLSFSHSVLFAQAIGDDIFILNNFLDKKFFF